MDERLKFVARLLEGEKMAVLCREFDISRKPVTRYSPATRTAAWRGSRIAVAGPIRQGCQLPFQIENLVLQLKREHPNWGAPKIRRKHSEIQLAAITDAASRFLLSYEALSST